MKFFKIFLGEHAPCFSIKLKLVLPKKIRLKKIWKLCPPPLKFLATPLVLVLLSCFLLNVSSVVRSKLPIQPGVSGIFILFINGIFILFINGIFILFRACPRTLFESFLFLNQIQISSAKKNTLKKIWKLCPPPPFKISRYATGASASLLFSVECFKCRPIKTTNTTRSFRHFHIVDKCFTFVTEH